jgi:hypothetical protein
VMAPRWSHPPYYVLHVERISGGDPYRLAAAVDANLRASNIEYDSKRRSDRLAPLKVNLLPDGYLSLLDRSVTQARAGRAEQYKHVFLYTVPGADESFPTAQQS